MPTVCGGEVWDSHDHFFQACFLNQVLGTWRVCLSPLTLPAFLLTNVRRFPCAPLHHYLQASAYWLPRGSIPRSILTDPPLPLSLRPSFFLGALPLGLLLILAPVLYFTTLRYKRVRYGK